MWPFFVTLNLLLLGSVPSGYDAVLADPLQYLSIDLVEVHALGVTGLDVSCYRKVTASRDRSVEGCDLSDVYQTSELPVNVLTHGRCERQNN